MTLSREARLMIGITLLSVPTIMYGGSVLLDVLTQHIGGDTPPVQLDDTQFALFRAGHAHAGVWLILSLVLQIVLDPATLGSGLKWTARLTGPIGVVAISGGFFGRAFWADFESLIYLGATSMAIAVVLTGIGLIRKP